MADLVEFLHRKYPAKHPTTKAEMLSGVIKEYQDHLPEIFSLDCEHMQLLIGIEVEEVDRPSDHTYVLFHIGGLTYNGIVSHGPVMLLGLILLEGDCAPKEKCRKH